MFKSLLSTIKKFSLITIIVSLVFGLLLLIYPEQSIKYMSLAIGVVVIVLGLIGVIDYFAKERNSVVLALGIVALVVGAVICFKYKSIIAFVGLLFGIFLLCSAITDFVSSIDAARVHSRSWVLTMILSVVSAVFGIVVIFRAFDVTTAIIRVIGVGLLVYTVMDVISFIQFQSVAKAVSSAEQAQSEIIDDNATIVSEEDDD